MNSDELTLPNSPSTSTTGGRRIRVRSLKKSSISQEASLPSIPSDDIDWVSPFTLPPLPALRKNRSHIDSTSDDRIHNRSGSSAYYAAAWGSPYAVPSPNQSPAVRTNRNKSFDLETSPLVSRHLSVNHPISKHTRRQSLPLHEHIDRADSGSTSPVDRESKHQRRNWLSESEDSANEIDQEIGETPTSKRKTRKSSGLSSTRNHQVQESVDTITPETFNGTSSPDKSLRESNLSQEMADTQTSSGSALEEDAMKEKPLPSLPEDSNSKDVPPTIPPRPSLSLPTPSFQRTKKKVPWKGKHCVIAMPMTDREQAGLPPVLTTQEKDDIMRRWAELGFPVHGFTIGDWAPIAHQGGGFSRSTYPDPQEMEHERKTTSATVRVHNLSEWQAWQEYLKEEKLRLLGVTPSTSEAAPSTVSPFSSNMSRVSSAYPSMAASPPIMSASAQPRMSFSPFSPNLVNSGPTGFTVTSRRGTPQLGGQRSAHGYTQSVAVPGMGQRINSPFDYFGLRTPGDQPSSRRPFSPGHVQNLQSMSHIVSPVGMHGMTPDFTRNFHSNPQIAHIQQQQEALARHQQQIQEQIVRAHHQRQMSLFPPRTMSTEQLPITPKLVSPEREAPEIMHPTPRSHRHNLSAALEKGVIDSVVVSGKELTNVVSEATKEKEDEVEEGEVQENEEETEELPILERPEVNNSADKDEIETNPSIAGTPMLMDDKNPFANFKPLVPAAQSRFNPGAGHSAQPSVTKLNVQAKEFNPTGAFSANAFDMDENFFMPKTTVTEKSIAGRPGFKSHQRNMSSLNVEAPVFTPIFAAKHSQPEGIAEIATFGNNSMTTPAKSLAAFSSKEVTPAFSHVSNQTPIGSNFSFRSANFNVEAPEFKPSASLSDIAYTPEKTADLKNSIFGNIVVDSSSKSQRRSKALPLVRPTSREATPDVAESADDADGRPIAPTDRNKRTRTDRPDKDDELLFAAHAPFTSLAEDKKQTEVVEETKQKSEQPSDDIESPETKGSENVVKPEVHTQPSENKEISEAAEKDLVPADVPVEADKPVHVEDIPATSAEPKKEEAVAQTSASVVEPAQEDIVEPRVESSKDATIEVESVKQVSAAKQEERTASPEVVAEPAKTSEADKPQVTIVDASDATEAVAAAITSDPAEEKSTAPAQPQDTEKPKPALSALATPFEFHPAAQDFVPYSRSQSAAGKTPEKAQGNKGAGLMASKFASSPPLQSTTPEVVKTQRSSPPLLFGEAKKLPAQEVPVTSGSAPLPTQHDIENEATDDDFDPQADELDRISNLEDHNEISRPESASSQVSDMPIEEINAVMRQFEENPDLGIIREDTPVKQTPLIDMRYRQHNFRSDAPSPSPNRRRLNGAFNIDRSRAYGGLGFEVEGVHQLGYGSGEVSDWNAALSPGQQDKLEARAHFFDDHVNDLVDNILESRLAPLERALATIQHAVQTTNVRARGRRSMSTDKNESDADDEDEYDAYEGYSHYRSMSPKKRDRRQETIKAAVMEAFSAAQATVPQIDMAQFQHALQEIRELSAKAATPAPQAAIDHSPIHAAIGELKTLLSQESKASASETSELRSMIEELKASRQHTNSETQKDVSTMHSALQEMRELLVQRAEAPPVDLTFLQEHVAEMKQKEQSRSLEDQSSNMKTILEDVIATHPRLRGSRVEQDHDGTQKLQLQISGLEAMLKVAEKRADGEAALRREAEDENDTLRTQLKEAQDLASTHKEASEEAQKGLQTVLIERQQSRQSSVESDELRHRNEELEKKVEALELTLDQYRKYKVEMSTELEAAHTRSTNLARSLDDVREQARNQLDSRDLLRDQLNRLQQRMTKVVEDVRHDEAEWRKREHDIMGKNQLLQSSLDHETHRRARLELDADKLQKEHRESLHFKPLHETAQSEISRLLKVISGLEADNKTHQDSAYRAQSELAYVNEKREEMLASHTSRLQDELDAAKLAIQNLQADSDARIARSQGQIDAAAVELQEQKSRHDQNMERMFENHNEAIRRANAQHSSDLDIALSQAKEKFAAELEQRLALHEEKLVALKHQHERDLKHADEDRVRLEQSYTEKLALGNDKIKHLESKIVDVEERYEVTKTAARAVVEAATAKGANLPTPANSVVASPPHRASISSASMSISRGTDLPEKISPQALRETIMVLQDQLQNREQKIDKLESELASIDKDAPLKVKERDTEVAMLRELLDVRLDDLQELISTLEKPNYDRAAIKDAAIRIKTQMKMEQQLKERALSGSTLANSLPAALSSGLVNLAQSPRAMVAAATWGNWQKVKDSGVSAVSGFANSVGAQTPSRSSSSPSSLLAGIMTPPETNIRSSDGSSQPSTARPLAAAAAARRIGTTSTAGARPLRAFSAQPRTLSGARPLARRGTNESRPGSSGSVIRMSEPSSIRAEPPSTPLAQRAESDFGDDVDEDASPLDGRERTFDSEDLEELVKSEQTAMRSSSPEASRSFVGADEDRVVVIEEES